MDHVYQNNRSVMALQTVLMRRMRQNVDIWRSIWKVRQISVVITLVTTGVYLTPFSAMVTKTVTLEVMKETVWNVAMDSLALVLNFTNPVMGAVTERGRIPELFCLRVSKSLPRM